MYVSEFKQVLKLVESLSLRAPRVNLGLPIKKSLQLLGRILGLAYVRSEREDSPSRLRADNDSKVAEIELKHTVLSFQDQLTTVLETQGHTQECKRLGHRI